ncbi:hypothetical protein K474DRAFT_1713676 [Panus rudis PR-1116 ss-1]|nr:hypothetical protein K474DRAFT_1713676 [Panus rudis PR-1116 ss-1]
MPRGSGQSGDLQATYIARIFQLCPGIRALISMSNANDFSPCKTILYHAPRSLRHLILYRNSVQSIFEYNTGAMFPGIEILSLRQSRITLGLETLEVPTLPDLIELNLVQIVFQSSRDLEILVQRVRASAEKLKTVRFLDMEVTNIWDSTALVRVPTPCEDLCLIDFHPFSDSLSTRTSSLHGVRHLTLGVLSPLWKPLTDWDLPDTLETLTLFVEIPQLRDHLAPEVFRMSVIHMSWIYQCLRRNIAAHPSRDSNQLRSVTMNLTGAHSANTVQNAILQESMAELRDLCLANKVSLVERELDVETWATAHLSRHLTNN